MGGTLRSPTISTQNRTIVKQATHRTNGVNLNSDKDDIPPVLVGDVSLSRIAILARKHPEMTFTSLAYRIDLAMLKEAFRRIKKSGAAGVDKVTASSYAEYLDQNWGV